VISIAAISIAVIILFFGPGCLDAEEVNFISWDVVA
jgi:hypothetical protein